jgi:hypothetical protein
MVTVFCLRLSVGLMASLLILPVSQIAPRFFRVHFLTALGLSGLAMVLSDLDSERAGVPFMWTTVAAMALLFIGSVVWHLEGAPLGRLVAILSTASIAFALAFLRMGAITKDSDRFAHILLFADDLTSAAVLGLAMTAMLIGHSYLISPTMSLTPLLRMLAALGISLFIRMAMAGVGLWMWTEQTASPLSETETVLWLGVRWVLGFFAPLILGWMAWETARIRSTQSATGILYVVVIVCFLGELTSQLLLHKTGHIL